MQIRVRSAFLAIAMTGAAASGAVAQQPGSPTLPAEVQEWIVEMQELQQQLEPIHERALQEPELQQGQREVAAALRAAMIEADSSMEAVLERMEELMREARAAQQAGDAERLLALGAEAEEIQPRLARAQAEAMEQPEVAARIAVFQARVHERMRQIEPAVGPLLDRFLELDRRITEALSGSRG